MESDDLPTKQTPVLRNKSIHTTAGLYRAHPAISPAYVLYQQVPLVSISNSTC